MFESRHEVPPQSSQIRPDTIDRKRSILGALARAYDSETALLCQRTVENLIVRQGLTEIPVSFREGIHHFHEHKLSVKQALDQFRLTPSSIREVLNDMLEYCIEVAAKGSTRPIVLRATTCPDYAYNPSTGTYLPDGGLGTGPGLCGLTILKKAAPLVLTMASAGIKTNLDFTYADIEADDPPLREKAGVSRDEFIARIEDSRASMGHAAQAQIGSSPIPNLEISTSMMSDIVRPYLRAMDGLDIPCHSIMKHRAPFYERFFAESLELAPDKKEAMSARALKDIRDHYLLGAAIHGARLGGSRESIVTLSLPCLVKYINFGRDRHVPVLRLEQEY